MRQYEDMVDNCETPEYSLISPFYYPDPTRCFLAMRISANLAMEPQSPVLDHKNRTVVECAMVTWFGGLDTEKGVTMVFPDHGEQGWIAKGMKTGEIESVRGGQRVGT